MTPAFRIICIIAVCAGVVTIGCSRKQIKVDVKPETVKQKAPALQGQEERVRSDEDVFEPLNIDEKIRDVLKPVFFEYDKWDLQAESIERLEKIVSFLSENPVIRLLVEGHADESGGNEYNIGLGEKRAKAAKEYLLSYGIKSSRLEHTSYGRERPALADCESELCHEMNRRVEWKVLAK